ncbi:MAG: UDP binding domain-containing protein, partial [Candidatus Omnitrophica bacterium]|nr:UDP binding domain-containing protein [Candidatus Omnitrophota bacterium]
EKNLKLKGAKILTTGVTYKRNIKDLRKSPSIDIIYGLHKKGALVSYFDPLIPYLKINGIDLRSVELRGENLGKFDCVVIAADHTGIDYELILRESKLIFDTRNVYKGRNDKKIVLL